MEAIFNVSYLLDTICVAVGFFTFIKLVSNDVYLTNHRLLPTIAGVITIFDFYIWIMPYVRTEETAQFLQLLCNLCSMVIIFMMFFYFLFIKKPKMVVPIVTITLTVMILLCVYDFLMYSIQKPKAIDVDVVACLFVFIGSLVVELKTPSKSFFDRTDKTIARYMMLAFVIAIVGYITYDIFPVLDRSRSFAFLLDCIIFYWLALSNRIEDKATIMKSIVYDSISYPICLVNADFYVIDCNKKGIELFPFASGIEFAFDDGSYKSKFILGETIVKNERNNSEYFAGDHWYRLNYTPVDDGKHIKGYIFSAIDITDQRNEATDAKRETAKKSQFLAIMSHELRSPLHAILGVSDILSTKKDISDKNKNLISHIKRASENLLELVNAILDYSKLEAGKFEFAERVYDVNAALEDLAYATILNIQSKPIEFNLAITSAYPRYLYGDVMRVREVFQNILTNAVKFTERGHIHSELSFKEEDGRVRVDFSISDTGQGMSPEQVNSVFKEYVTSADGVEMEGTGLGLAIVKQLIAMMDGSISAESDGMNGSVFKGYFYQKPSEGEYLTERVLNKMTLMNQNQGLFHGIPEKVDYIYPRASILVADDMKINLEIMQQMLAPWKAEVITVPDGGAAIEAVKEHKFDLILLDQMMSPVSGPDACKAIKEFSDAPIVLVTANSEDSAKTVMCKCKFSDFLSKPILGAKLQEIVEKYLPKELAEPNTGETVLSAVKRNRQNSNVYKKTLEAFVKEMQPMLLNLPSYRQTDKEMFKVKVHGINGVSKQIGRDTFAKQAQIMEMAAKSDTWSYVDEHLDEFLNSLCEVVEDATKELTQLAPQREIDVVEEIRPVYNINELLQQLKVAFDEYDLAEIEKGLDSLSHAMKKDEKLNDLYDTLKIAYDNLEYDDGIDALDDYMVEIND